MLRRRLLAAAALGSVCGEDSLDNADQTCTSINGVVKCGGEAEQNWLILRNGSHTIGLFQGMFEKNILTFNPGWDANCEKLD